MKKVVLSILFCILCIASGSSQIITNRPAPGSQPPKINEQSLLSFSIEIASPDESGGMSTRTSTEPVQIFSNGAYRDTTHIVSSCEMTNRSILALYQHAYTREDYFRFIYDEELNYINSENGHESYNMNIMVSNLVGNIYEILEKQLNMTFGLKAGPVLLDTTAYVLKKIIPSGKLRPIEPQNNTSLAASTSSQKVSIEGTCKAYNIAYMIQNTIQIPVIVEGIDEQTLYEVNLEFKNDTGDLNSWLKAFEKEGIILEKGIREVKYIRIEKDKQ